MEFQRNEYPAMLASLEPSAAIKLLDDRIKHISQTNIDIADWLEERRKAEETYVAALNKLARLSPPGANSELGIFTTPWQKVVGAAEIMAESHRSLAKAIERDVEKPLRDFANKSREVQALTTTRGNLASIAKDIETATKKMEKLQSKGTHAAANKVAGNSNDIESANSQWESQAPFVFESLQAADESRCNHLRDVLTQFQTHEIDRLDRIKKASESTVNSLLNCDTADEVKNYASRHSGTKSNKLERPKSRTIPPSSASAAIAASSSSLAPPTSPPNGDDAASQHSTSALDEKDGKKSRFGGLKRLGTVMSRRKSTQPPPPPSKSRSGKANLREAGQRRQDSASRIPEMDEDEDDERTGTLRDSNNIQRSESSQLYETSSAPQTNGASVGQLPEMRLQEPLMPTIAASTGAAAVTSQESTEYASPPARAMDPIAQAQQEAASVSDSYGQPYNFNIQSAPLTETSPNQDNENVMASVASTLRAQAPAGSRRSGTVRGRRDQRNSFLPPAEESGTSASSGAAIGAGAVGGAALGAGAAATLPSLSPHLGSAISTGSPTSIQATPPQVSPAFPPPQQYASPVMRSPAMPSSVADDSADTQSIRSSHSLASSTAQSAVVKHGEMHSPGLNSSIVETVSAWQDHGAVTHAMIIGELAIAYNGAITSPRESIRLDNFASLDKVAPNPSFVAQTSPERAGEYHLDLSPISGPRPAVAFKYQVHVDAGSLGKHAPLLLTPSWRVQPNQTSVILTYSLNPAFSSSPTTLHNVMLVISLGEGGSRAVSCQSKPVGTFSKERNCIYWRLDELQLAPGQTSEKVLARFATPEGEAKTGKVEARWEIAAVGSGIGSGLGLSIADSGASDPFADEERAQPLTWKPVQGVRKLISGTYTAQ